MVFWLEFGLSFVLRFPKNIKNFKALSIFMNTPFDTIQLNFEHQFFALSKGNLFQLTGDLF